MDSIRLFQRSQSKNGTAVTTVPVICTLEICPIWDSYYNYRPSLPANAIFLAIFSLSLICFLVQAVLSRRFIAFSVALICGCILEVIGYGGRIISYINPFDMNGFLIQICCLTIAPAFMAAGLYLCLSRIINTFGRENSRIAPLSYPRIFIPCDVVSLVLQAIGGGMASVATQTGKSPDNGDHIMVAGLAFQVFTLLIFIILCSDFAIRTVRRMNAMGDLALDPTHAKLRQSWSFKAFLCALTLATVCIFIRSTYRVAELSEGWEGALIKNQSLFIGLEGVMVAVAALALNAFHPGICFREGYDLPLRKIKTKKSKSKKNKPSDAEKESEAGSRDESGSENVVISEA